MFKSKVIAHIDMNSYFATCLQQANPLLRGKPIGVCEHLGGIIIAASVEAKRLGIKTGTPVWEAKKIYPKIELFHTDPDMYRETTARFLKIFMEYTEQVEKYSIDEAFLDLTDNVKNFPDPWKEAERIALEIKQKMYKRVGNCLTCSIGISDNKLIAKICSDLQKPNGLVVMPPELKHTLYDRLKLTDVPGIGSRTERSLNLMGIRSLKDLRDYPETKLSAHFGIIQARLLHSAGQLQGSWKETISTEEDDDAIKSMGHMYTLPQRTNDPKVAEQVLFKLSEMVGRRLRDSNMEGNIIHFMASDKKHHNYWDRRHKLGEYIRDGKDIHFYAQQLFRQGPLHGEVLRLIGVTVAGLRPFVNQEPLFDQERRKGRLINSMDVINDKYGEFTITPTPAWQAREYIRDSVGFGRMKEFKVKFKPGKS